MIGTMMTSSPTFTAAIITFFSYLSLHPAMASLGWSSLFVEYALPLVIANVYLFNVHTALGVAFFGLVSFVIGLVLSVACELDVSVWWVSYWFLTQAFLTGVTPYGWHGFWATACIIGTLNHGPSTLVWTGPQLVIALWAQSVVAPKPEAPVRRQSPNGWWPYLVSELQNLDWSISFEAMDTKVVHWWQTLASVLTRYAMDPAGSLFVWFMAGLRTAAFNIAVRLVPPPAQMVKPGLPKILFESREEAKPSLPDEPPMLERRPSAAEKQSVRARYPIRAVPLPIGVNRPTLGRIGTRGMLPLLDPRYATAYLRRPIARPVRSVSNIAPVTFVEPAWNNGAPAHGTLTLARTEPHLSGPPPVMEPIWAPHQVMVQPEQVQEPVPLPAPIIAVEPQPIQYIDLPIARPVMELPQPIIEFPEPTVPFDEEVEMLDASDDVDYVSNDVEMGEAPPLVVQEAQRPDLMDYEMEELDFEIISDGLSDSSDDERMSGSPYNRCSTKRKVLQPRLKKGSVSMGQAINAQPIPMQGVATSGTQPSGGPVAQNKPQPSLTLPRQQQSAAGPSRPAPGLTFPPLSEQALEKAKAAEQSQPKTITQTIGFVMYGGPPKKNNQQQAQQKAPAKPSSSEPSQPSQANAALPTQKAWPLAQGSSSGPRLSQPPRAPTRPTVDYDSEDEYEDRVEELMKQGMDEEKARAMVRR